MFCLHEILAIVQQNARCIGPRNHFPRFADADETAVERHAIPALHAGNAGRPSEPDAGSGPCETRAGQATAAGEREIKNNAAGQKRAKIPGKSGYTTERATARASEH